MSNINTLGGEKIAVVGVVNPGTVANTEQFTVAIDMSRFHQALGIAMLGNLAAETVNFRAYRCDSAGNNRVQLKAVTQLAADAAANDNKQILINVRGDEVTTASETARYVCFGLVTGGATGGPCAVLALGVDARSQPGSADDLASVVQIVA